MSMDDKIADAVSMVSADAYLFPCPCCGSHNLYAGASSALRFGVECRDCGLGISRAIPSECKTSFAKCVEQTFRAAILAWNSRRDAWRPVSEASEDDPICFLRVRDRFGYIDLMNPYFMHEGRWYSVDAKQAGVVLRPTHFLPVLKIATFAHCLTPPPP